MTESLIYEWPLYTVFLVSCGALFITIAIGSWHGRIRHQDPGTESLYELIPTSLLGLLALLMGFTFSMSLSRFDKRKEAMVAEANAIETAWLRAGLMPPRERVQARGLLVDYLSHRIKLPSAAVALEVRKQFDEENEIAQAKIWALTRDEALKTPTVIQSLFTQSVNELIDKATERAFAAKDHVPEVAHLSIFSVMASSLYFLAFVYGWRRQRTTPLYVLAALLVLVLSIIQDMDRPNRGLIKVEPHLLRQLHESLLLRDAGS